MRAMTRSFSCGLACALSVVGHEAGAIESTFSGFATVAVGKTFGDCRSGSSMSTTYADECTTYIADWGHAGVYTPKWSASEESRVGLQWDAKLTQDVSGTVQLTGRLTPGQKAGIEWAYLSYTGVKDWTFQLGRKRLPLYYYSDFQDVGYAYNTVRPSPDVYGWDVVNYNGASARYQTRLGEWSLRQDFFWGSETSKDNPYAKLITTDKTSASFRNIIGASFEANRDWFTTRLTYATSDYDQKVAATNERVIQPSGDNHGPQAFYGIALNADFDNWIVRSEFDVADRSKFAYSGHFYLVNVGYRMGAFIPTLGTSGYHETTKFPDAYVPVKTKTLTAALRYEVTGKSDLKLQFDHAIDHSSPPFAGSAQAVTIAYDVVF